MTDGSGSGSGSMILRQNFPNLDSPSREIALDDPPRRLERPGFAYVALRARFEDCLVDLVPDRLVGHVPAQALLNGVALFGVVVDRAHDRREHPSLMGGLKVAKPSGAVAERLLPTVGVAFPA